MEIWARVLVSYSVKSLHISFLAAIHSDLLGVVLSC